MTSKKEQFYIQRIAELEAQLKQRDERIWTVLATCASQGRSAFDFIYQSIQAHFSDQPLPSLLGP